MRIHALLLGVPAAIGLACSTPSSGSSARTSSARTSRASTDAAASAPSATNPGMRAEEGAQAGAASDVKGHASDQVITGRVAQSDGRTLTIQSADGTQRSLHVADQTVVTIDGRDAHVADLAPGQDVRASFNEVDGREIAVKVEAMGATGTGSGGYTPGTPPGAHPPDGSRNDAGRGGTTGAPESTTPQGATSPGTRY
ncbi:hypothetical protein [Anaeromyxobacter sp. PSR-1]|uniref:hypothetical protein n=1 Tax=unclassified Anaeromyxobacter TaxID=2620896 RepID=UPI0005E45D81|nr:hypothetical protein [Anaeromyxobacter sp. PSR-1]GAO04229.1 hypothetical protein PSR1_03119 [Anaeromyxobacter sp. PSR-1]